MTVKPHIRYSLDLVSKSGGYESCPHFRNEEEIFETKEEIIANIQK